MKTIVYPSFVMKSHLNLDYVPKIVIGAYYDVVQKKKMPFKKFQEISEISVELYLDLNVYMEMKFDEVRPLNFVLEHMDKHNSSKKINILGVHIMMEFQMREIPGLYREVMRVIRNNEGVVQSIPF